MCARRIRVVRAELYGKVHTSSSLRSQDADCLDFLIDSISQRAVACCPGSVSQGSDRRPIATWFSNGMSAISYVSRLYALDYLDKGTSNRSFLPRVVSEQSPLVPKWQPLSFASTASILASLLSGTVRVAPPWRSILSPVLTSSLCCWRPQRTTGEIN